MKVCVWRGGTRRADIICRALQRGIEAAGDSAIVREANSFAGVRDDCEACGFYGLRHGGLEIMAAYTAAGRRAVFLDIGYFGRDARGRIAGYHRLAVDAYHATEFDPRRRYPGDRASALDIAVEARRTGGRHVVIAGMSAKAAAIYGLPPEEWERRAVRKLSKITGRPIVYRPKPKWKGARPIAGARFAPDGPFLALLGDAHCVVTHHSNVGIEAVLAGVPLITIDGIAKPVARDSLLFVEDPCRPDDELRRNWVNYVAYRQWTVREIESGAMWRHLNDEGLLD